MKNDLIFGGKMSISEDTRDDTRFVSYKGRSE